MEDPTSSDALYRKVSSKASEIKAELKRLNRWQHEPMSADKFENMGAFGSNTMTYEQWIQFILLLRIQEIINERGEFPSDSNLSTYAVRAFDGDDETNHLKDLLYDLDQIINGTESEYYQPYAPSSTTQYNPKVDSIPEVVFTLADLLPQFTGNDLESQLQTFDTFLDMLDTPNRLIVSDLFVNAAGKASDPVSKERILKASRDVAQGGRAAELYNHNEAMRKYQEDHKKNYPS
jgi:uncharacterized protein YqcC (DUF446 family)